MQTVRYHINQVCDWTEDAEHDDAPDSMASLLRVILAKRRTGDRKPLLYG